MSVITSNPANDPGPQLDGAQTPFRRMRPAPAFQFDLRRSLRMYPRTALGVGLLVLLAALLYAMRLKPSYQAESRVYVEPALSSPLNDPSSTGLFDSVRYDSYLQQQMQTATRSDILRTAISSLPPGTWQLPGEPLDNAVVRLQAALKVARVTTSYQVAITLTGADPAKTAAVVNAVTKAYLDAGRKDELSSSTARAGILNEERNRIDQELAAARAEQTSLAGSLGVAKASITGPNPYDDQLTTLRSELLVARQAHDAASAQLTSLAGNSPTATSGLDAMAVELANSDAGLASLKGSVNQRRATLRGQMAAMKPDNPLYQQDQDELADLDRSLDTMTAQLHAQAARRVADKLRVELARTGAIEARLNAAVAQGTSAAGGAAPKLQRSEELSANITRLTARYATVDDALRTLALETHSMPMAHLSLAAAVPQHPEPSRQNLILLAALPLALLAGCAAAIAQHVRNKRIFIGSEVTGLLGFAPIAVLPARADVSEPVFGEYVLRLAGGIESAYRTRGARTYVLTPASASTAIRPLVDALAAKLGDLGLDVAMLRTAHMLESASSAAVTGVSSLAVKADTARDGIAGSVLDRLKRDHNIVFIEAPALLSSAEAEYVARTADATIVVAESGVTLKEELLDAAALLERLNVTGVGTVLESLKVRFADRAFQLAVTMVEKRAGEGSLGRAGADTSGVRTAAPSASASAPVAAVAETTAAPATAPVPLKQEDAPFAPQAATTAEPPAPVAVAESAPVTDEKSAASGAPIEGKAEPPAPVDETRPKFEPLWEPPVPWPVSQPAPLAEREVLPHATVPALAAAVQSEPAAQRATNVQAAKPAESVPSSAPQPIPIRKPFPTSTPGIAVVPPATRRAAVWPEQTSFADHASDVHAFEQELLSANGTSVFLRPRPSTERRAERLEPLGAQNALNGAATLLANSFGPLPVDLPADVAENSAREADLLLAREVERLSRSRRVANGRSLVEEKRSLPEPLKMSEIRRLLNPVAPETGVETRTEKDMIGARAVSEAAGPSQPKGSTPEGDGSMSEKKNWFQKLFSRETESIDNAAAPSGSSTIAPVAEPIRMQAPPPTEAAPPPPSAPSQSAPTASSSGADPLESSHAAEPPVEAAPKPLASFEPSFNSAPAQLTEISETVESIPSTATQTAMQEAAPRFDDGASQVSAASLATGPTEERPTQEMPGETSSLEQAFLLHTPRSRPKSFLQLTQQQRVRPAGSAVEEQTTSAHEAAVLPAEAQAYAAEMAPAQQETHAAAEPPSEVDSIIQPASVEQPGVGSEGHAEEVAFEPATEFVAEAEQQAGLAPLAEEQPTQDELPQAPPEYVAHPSRGRDRWPAYVADTDEQEDSHAATGEQTAEPPLSRRWGLLSRFEQPAQQGLDADESGRANGERA